MEEIQLPITWMNSTNDAEQKNKKKKRQVAKEHIPCDSIFISSKLNCILFRTTYVLDY